MIFTNDYTKHFAGQKPNELPALALAYIGDAVYDMYVRSVAINQGLTAINDLHHYVVGHVCASAQSKAVYALMDKLSQDEIRIFKRGRNAKSAPPKNADLTEYKNATGFEALLGYLYLNGEQSRLYEILDMAVSNRN